VFKSKKISLPLPVITCALFVFIITNILSYFVFSHIPHIHDEICYLFQAKIFKSGQLYAPSPPCSEFFDFPHMINNGRWYSQYPPGYPFLLLLGLLIGAPWIINPIIASLSIIAFYFLGKEIYSAKVGVLASFLGSVSIWFLLMSSSMLSHTSSLFFTSLFLLFTFRSLKNPSLLNGSLMGLFLGFALLIRPFNAVLFSIPFCAYYFFYFLKSPKKRLVNFAGFSVAITTCISLLLIYNYLTNGNPFLMGYVVCYGKKVLPGFGNSPYPELVHTWMNGVNNIIEYIKHLNKYLFGWPLTSFFGLFPILWMSIKNKAERNKTLLLSSGIFTLLGGLFFYWGTFILIGPRLAFETIPLFVLLSSQGIHEFPRLLSSKYRKFNLQTTKKAMAAILSVFICYAAFIRFPNWLRPKDTEYPFETYSQNFSLTTNKINNTINFLNLKNALIIMNFINSPPKYFPSGGWGSGFLYNRPDLETEVIYVNNQGRNNAKLLNCFPNRSFYLYIGTVEKGMLLPIKITQHKITYSTPVLIKKSSKNLIELLDSPQKLYKIYSKEFGQFLDKIYSQYNFTDINTEFLIELGKRFQRNKNYVESIYCFEAALQIEKWPDLRLTILNLLQLSYFKAGKIQEAKRVVEIVKNTMISGEKPYFVFPEKGF